MKHPISHLPLPYASAYDHPTWHDQPANHRGQITRNHIKVVLDLLSDGESIDKIISLLEAKGSNGAISQIANSNQLIGVHREDLLIRLNLILTSRKRTKPSPALVSP